MTGPSWIDGEWPRIGKYPRCEFREITEDDVARMPPVDPALADVIDRALIEAIESTAPFGSDDL